MQVPLSSSFFAQRAVHGARKHWKMGAMKCVPALLLSVAMHTSMFFTLHLTEVSDSTISTDERLASPNVFSVHMEEANSRPAPVSTTGPAPEATVKQARAENHGIGSAQSEPVANSALSVIAMPEVHYFHLQELTDKPQVVHDVFPDLVLILPDMEPQPAQLRLFINETGDVDKVEIEEAPRLSSQARDFLISAFTTVKFQPGRIGDMPVKSQLKIEVNLESAAHSE
jgi:hypothetical protein